MKRFYAALVAVVMALVGISNVAALAAAGLGAEAANAAGSLGGAYLGFAAWLALAARREKLVEPAVLSAVAVMAGLLSGRVAALTLNGGQGAKFWISAGVELIFAVWGLVLMRKGVRG
jgi:hypothetical protein